MITTHILDTARGRPAVGVSVVLDRRSGSEWISIGASKTDANGRISTFSVNDPHTGQHRLTFATASYFHHLGVTGFFPEVTVVFNVETVKEHYHVPLLLSPFGYSTYRGS